MGLCKCPKRKVTNQFCFEHRVNVCENCMVTNHPKCVIQSYLQWLQDSDCNPICTFCNESLSSRECCRLTCYHVYHWACLDSHCKNLSESKNDANYICSICTTSIIPLPNLVSPVADVLREKLASVNWARAAQGLPLLSHEKKMQEQTRYVTESVNAQSYHSQDHVISSSGMSRTSGIYPSSSSNSNVTNSNDQKLGPPYSVVNVECNSGLSNATSKKVFEAYDDPKDFSFDHDENKYQRKSAIEWFLRWWKLITKTPVRRRATAGSVYKRYINLIIVGIGLLILVIIVFSWLGKMATDGDPAFDVRNNYMVNMNENVDSLN